MNCNLTEAVKAELEGGYFALGRGILEIERRYVTALEGIAVATNNPSIFDNGSDMIARRSCAIEAVEPKNQGWLGRQFSYAGEGIVHWAPETIAAFLGAYGGPFAAGAAAGFVEGLESYGHELLDIMEREGIDVTDPEEIHSFFESDNFAVYHHEALENAGVDGLITGVSAGVGTYVIQAAGAGKVLRGTVAETATQTTLDVGDNVLRHTRVDAIGSAFTAATAATTAFKIKGIPLGAAAAPGVRSLEEDEIDYNVSQARFDNTFEHFEETAPPPSLRGQDRFEQAFTQFGL